MERELETTKVVPMAFQLKLWVFSDHRRPPRTVHLWKKMILLILAWVNHPRPWIHPHGQARRGQRGQKRVSILAVSPFQFRETPQIAGLVGAGESSVGRTASMRPKTRLRLHLQEEVRCRLSLPSPSSLFFLFVLVSVVVVSVLCRKEEKCHVPLSWDNVVVDDDDDRRATCKVWGGVVVVVAIQQSPVSGRFMSQKVLW